MIPAIWTCQISVMTSVAFLSFFTRLCDTDECVLNPITGAQNEEELCRNTAVSYPTFLLQYIFLTYFNYFYQGIYLKVK